ncbi:tail fiber assembly protein [Cronobacter sp. EKM101R]|uniref:tail fiber assembly protein n=1 Tax=unclassified Cronobacter TaxID=2649764 RepID=UPI0013EC298B|nr:MULTISPECIES: tail fiber assembly protein [unclassified Cronobacter]ELY4543923.1 tail fiber assembly protein [Cronobacter sakazakii]KAF6596216.1 tail fiber assembly protein [Cronobacter sp. EKM101R]KAF6599043.1 tail fiber assembly protein [Cronobacter sp. EKM102R]
MKFTNFKLYHPENIDAPELNIAYLVSDEGNDWYESQSLFSGETLKIAFDEKGIIRSCSEDVSLLWPVGLSVTEIDKNTVPDGFDISGKWIFNGTKIAPYELSADELIVEAKNKKERLLREALEIITPLQDAVELDMATETEIADLAAWRRYRVLLNRVNPSDAPDIDWPARPIV